MTSEETSERSTYLEATRSNGLTSCFDHQLLIRGEVLRYPTRVVEVVADAHHSVDYAERHKGLMKLHFLSGLK